jgi:UDP-N-acetyl-D-glucosamine dehydrogenase
MSAKADLIEKFRTKTAVIGILGLGYVGVPLSLRYADAGLKVIGFDVDKRKVAMLNEGRSGIEHIGNDKIAAALGAGFEATSDMSRAREADALIICVPTPLDRYREPDLSYVEGTVDAVAPYLRTGHLVSLESTTYPGTTEEIVLPRLQKSGLTVGEDFFLVYSPEREDPGNANYSTQTIPKVCGGLTPACLEVGVALYELAIDRVVPVSSPRAAEMTKLLENIHRVVNIGLVNEMKIIATRMDIDIHEVIAAAATKPFGFTPYYPGPGIGGHCIPVDPFYLTWKAREYDVHTRFIELAGEINTNMPRWVLDRVIEALNDHGKAVKGSKILVLGIAYKKNIDDLRESPALTIIELLAEKGADISYSDPHVPVFEGHGDLAIHLESVPLSPEMLQGIDLALLVTNHDRFDYDMLRTHAPLIVDTRGVFREAADNIVKA